MSALIIDNHIIDAPIETILNTIRAELTNGKLRHFTRRGDNYSVTCPTHKDGRESHPSCQIYCGDSKDVEYGHMYCFTCGEQGPLWHFVGQCFDADDEFGKRWLIDRFGDVYDDRELDLSSFDLSYSTHDKNEVVLPDKMQKWHPYMQKRRLSREICERFGVGYDPKTECIVFPVWDENGRLCMATRRSTESKMFFIDKGKEKPVYLLNFVNDYGIDEVTVVESQMNALTAWGWGYPTVALFGTGTEHQYDVLNRSSIRHYYLCFDGDEAGRKGIRRFLKNVRKDVFVDIIIMKEGKDVNDLTRDEYESLPIVAADEWLRTNGE